MQQMAGNVQQLFGTVGNAVKKMVDPSGDGRLTHDLDELLKKAQDARRPYEGQWLLNCSFYFGKQWVIFSQALGTLDKPPSDEPWRVRPNINFVGPAVLTSYAKITQTRQTARTQPGGTSPDDEKDARACDKLLDYLEPTAGAEEARAKATQWMLITGTGLLKDCWDKSLGAVVAQDPQTGKDVHEGEIQEYAISPFEFYGEPGCLEIEEMEWCFHVTLRPASYVKRMWGIDVSESEYDDSMTYETQLRSIISGEGGKEKGCIVKEFFRRPTDEYPGGQYVVYVNDNVVEEGKDEQGESKNPSNETPLPFTPLRANPRPGSFWGLAFVDNMIDPQRIYNKTKGEGLEIQRLTSKPKHLVPIGSLMEGKEITNAPGEDIRYTPVNGLKPEVMKGADIPEGYHKVIDTTRSELYDASGQHEVSHGQSPFTRTATGIAYLQEQDDARLAPIIRNYDRAFEKSSEAKLKLARQYYDEPRLLHIVGADNKTEVVAFSRDMIPNNINVHIQAGGSALPRSRVARQDFLLKLWTLPRPIIDDPKVMLDLLEFGEISGVYENIKQDINQAGRENDTMTGTVNGAPAQAGAMGQPTQGQEIVPRDFHNHLVHIKEHNKVRNSVQYEEMAQPTQQIIDKHVALHQQMYSQQVLTMQQNLAGNAAGQANAMKPTGTPAAPNTPPAAPPTPSGLGHLFEQTGPTGEAGPANGGGQP
jgi:hypothetical protein